MFRFGLNLFIFSFIVVIFKLLLSEYPVWLRIAHTLYYFTPTIAVLITEKSNTKEILRRYKVGIKELDTKRALITLFVVAFAYPLLCIFWMFLFGNIFQIEAFSRIIIPEGGYTLEGILISEVKFIRFGVFYCYSVCLGLIAGLTYNMLFELGGEIAWRGFLGKYFPFGYVKKCIIVGLIWGTWFLPVVFLNPTGMAIIINYAIFIASSFLLEIVYRNTHSLFIPAAVRGILISSGWMFFNRNYLYDGSYEIADGVISIMSIITFVALFYFIFKEKLSFSQKTK